MYIYIALILCLFLLRKSKKGLISCTILLLLSGFRDVSVGTDTVNYLRSFNNPNSWERVNDFIWVYINRFILDSGLSFNYTLLVSSFIFLLMITLTARKLKVNVGLTLFYLTSLFYYFQSFNITRQFISISFVLYAFTFIKDKKLVLFLLFIFIASGFHFSAVFIIPFYFISTKHQHPALVILVLASTFFVGGFVSIISLLGKIKLDIIYNSVLVNDLDLGFSLSRFLLNVYVSYLVLLNKGTSLFINLFIVGVILLNLLAPFGYIGRVAYYFIIVQVVLLPEYQLLENKRLHAASIVYSLVIFFYLLFNNNGGIYPYKFSSLVF